MTDPRGVVARRAADLWRGDNHEPGPINQQPLTRSRTNRGRSQPQLVRELRTLAARRTHQLPADVSVKRRLASWENGHSAPDEFYGPLIGEANYGPHRLRLDRIPAKCPVVRAVLIRGSKRGPLRFRDAAVLRSVVPGGRSARGLPLPLPPADGLPLRSGNNGTRVPHGCHSIPTNSSRS